MDSNEPDTHSFVVKVWLEESEQGNVPRSWRGHITHVVTGERRYLQSLAEIAAFIEPYLARMGVVPRSARRRFHWGRGKTGAP